VSVDKDEKIGFPDMDLVSTSMVERQNLTIRMQVRRRTRLTNAFSKKLENLQAALDLHFTHYNMSIPGTYAQSRSTRPPG